MLPPWGMITWLEDRRSLPASWKGLSPVRRPASKPPRLPTLSLLCLLAGGLLMGTPAYAQQTLTLLAPPGSVGPELLERFRKDSGISVVLREQADLAEMERGLLAGTAAADAVMVPAFPYLRRQIEAGVYARLDAEAIPHLGALDPQLTQLLSHADPTGDHAVLYSWQMLALGLVGQRVPADISLAGIGFSSLFDPAVAERFSSCGIALLDAPEHIIPVVLLLLGVDANSQNPADLELARARLEALRPFVQIVSAEKLVQGLAQGRFCAAIAWAGQLEQAKAAMASDAAKAAAAAADSGRQELVALKEQTDALAERAATASADAGAAASQTQDIAAAHPDVAEIAAALKEAVLQAETAARAAETARLAAAKLARGIAVKEAEAAAEDVADGEALTIRLPATGAVARFTMLAVPAKSANKAEAQRLIDWLLAPDNALANTLETRQPNAVPAAAPPAELAADPLLFPSESMRKNLTSLVQVSQTVERQRSRIWAMLKKPADGVDGPEPAAPGTANAAEP